MSVHVEHRATGLVYKVRWRQGGRQRAKVFNPARLGGPRKARKLADAFDVQMAQLAATGNLELLHAGTTTLADYEQLWWERYATQRLADSTLAVYATVLDLYILPRFGHWQLRDITPAHVEDWIVALSRRGIGAPTIRKSCAVLQGILKRAVRDREITSNPVAQVDKPRAPRTRTPIIVPVETVEAMRAWLLQRGQLGDATLLSVLAYAGPRPESEALPLQWSAIGKQSITLDASKKHGRQRTFRMLDPLAQDLAVWRRARGHRLTGLVFGFHHGHASTDGHPWTGEEWDRWRDRVFRKAATEVGLPKTVRPRDLRNSLASLLIWEGRSVVEVADILGHSRTMCLNTYASVLEEYDPANRRPANQVIADARAGLAVAARSAAQ
jgi:site-specific recombinase XerD